CCVPGHADRRTAEGRIPDPAAQHGSNAQTEFDVDSPPAASGPDAAAEPLQLPALPAGFFLRAAGLPSSQSLRGMRMSEPIRIGIAGYGNLGRGVEAAIAKNPD